MIAIGCSDGNTVWQACNTACIGVAVVAAIEVTDVDDVNVGVIDWEMTRSGSMLAREIAGILLVCVNL